MILKNAWPVFGTYQIANEETKETVARAISAGYRDFDTAASYGNDLFVGQALSLNGLERTAYHVTSKLWNNSRGYDEVFKAFRKTLRRMKLEYLDTYMIHWPASPALYEDWQQKNAETWRAFEALHADGLIRRIGVSNFYEHHLKALMDTAQVMPMVDQIEFHPGQTQTETIAFCQINGIELEAWSPLGSGALLSNPALKEIADRNYRSVAQICLRFCYQSGLRPVCKSTSIQRMVENSQVHDFELSANDMNELCALPYCGGSGLDPDTITKFG